MNVPPTTDTAPAVDLLRAGDLGGALQAQRERVRAAPTAAAERVFLFQLLAVLGQWQRAEAQLQAAVQLDASLSLLGSAGHALLCAEQVRAEVFAGTRLPPVLGTPQPWLAPLLQAVQLQQQGHIDAAIDLREQAFSQAPAVAGDCDGEPFEWIADADPRFGPCLEVITPSGYAWLPLDGLAELRIDPPEDLRDLVWAPAELHLRQGTALRAFLPVRYPGSEAGDDSGLQLARRSEWDEHGIGSGQRMLATDSGDHPLLQIRQLRLQRAD
ncbi:type VI secretion system accessory protein TagJ [Stenotrophomonas sp. WED208]|uniref:type VI secretion system accessory protein TagJ n=1 Tax=Stenotrophomonas sp. WED208 TaxID=3112800 RepID=UPI0034D75787